MGSLSIFSLGLDFSFTAWDKKRKIKKFETFWQTLDSLVEVNQAK